MHFVFHLYNLGKEPRQMKAKTDMPAKKKFSLRWIAVSVICIYAVITILSQQSTLAGQRKQQEELLARQEALESKVMQMQSEKDSMGSDGYVERSAREKFGWVKEGEIIFKRTPNGVVTEGGA